MPKLKCTKFDFGWGIQRSPDRFAGFKGAYFQVKGGEEGREGMGREGRGLLLRQGEIKGKG